MTIERKIAEIISGTKLNEATDINDPSDGNSDNPDQAKNRVGKQEIGGKDKAANTVTKNAETAETSNIDKLKTDDVTKEEGKNPDNARGIKEDIDALINGEDLSEEFKEKAATIFEAAVLSRVKSEVSSLEESYKIKLDEEIEVFKEGLVEKIDGYLDYIVEQWIAQNEIALESGMKSEILENFVDGLKTLFEENYIEIPEEKFDVLAELQEQVAALSTKLDEQMASNVELKTLVNENNAEKIVNQYAEGLAETDKEKFFSLVEELEIDGIESFDKKVKTIRESYFTNKERKPLTESVVTDLSIDEDPSVKRVDPVMQQYLTALDRANK